MILVGKFELRGALPYTLNQARAKHWRKVYQESKLWRTLVYHQCHQLKIIGLKLSKAHVKCTRFSSHEPDYDNLAGSFKHVIDGLVMAQVIIDDNPDVIGRPEYVWEKVKPKDKKIQIEVFRVDALCKASQTLQNT